ncbi:MAG TPA: alpha/beta hydrolase [Bacteroidia bacterium]|jgi:acetyl esterase/lipase
MLAFKILWLVCSILIFFTSLLCVMRAPSYLTWKLAVGASEFPLQFAMAALLIFFSGLFIPSHQSNFFIYASYGGSILSIGAVVFFLYPVLTSAFMAVELKKENKRSPFSFLKLFGHRQKTSPANTYCYKTIEGLQLKLDHYPSANPAPSPCVLVIHGGSWSSGDSKQLPELNHHLSQKGYHVIAINYRLAPTYHNPAPAEDVLDAIEYIEKNAVHMNIDPTRLVLLGRSAGGQIALLSAYVMSIRKNIKGVISFYAPANMVWGWSIPGNPLVMDSRQVMSDYIGGTFDEMPQKFQDSSPIEFVQPGVPPTLLIHGGNDCMVSPEHSNRLAKKLAYHKVKYQYLHLPWATHGFDYNLNGPGGQLSTYVIEEFLEEICKKIALK